jgi:hypothetical protein
MRSPLASYTRFFVGNLIALLYFRVNVIAYLGLSPDTGRANAGERRDA